MKSYRPDFLRNFKFEYRITINYFIFGFLWILFSDNLLDFFLSDNSLLTEFQTFKGSLFIIVTSGFLYLLVKRHMQKLRIAESQRIESESHYRALFNDNLSVILLINSDTGIIEDANQAACNYYGWTHSELCKKSIYDINTLDFEQINPILKAVVSEIQNHYEFQHLLANGEVRDVEVFTGPIRLGNKTLIYFHINDITERKRQEEQLYESEFRFNKLYENGPFGMVMADREFRFKKANPSFCRIMGYSEAELQQFTFNDVSHPDDLLKDLPNITKLMKKEISVYKTEKRYIRKDGRLLWGSLTVTATYDSEGEFLYNLAIIEDITHRKQAEEDLKKGKKLLSETESIGKVGGWELNVDTMQQTWTDEVYRIHEVDFNFTPTVDSGIDFYAAECKPIVENAIQRVIGLGEPFDLELELITAKGNSRSVHSVGKADIENRRVYGFIQDITDRKRAEEQINKLNTDLENRIAERTNQLLDSNKELESFAYSVSHDLRAPLRHVIGFAVILESELSNRNDPEITRLTGKIKGSASKMNRLIDELLTYSRLGRTDLKTIKVSLNTIIDDIIKEAADITKDRKIEWDISRLPDVYADPTLIKLVLENLIFNSLKFTSKKKKAVIKIGYEDKNKKEYTFYIKDNGAGFKMEYANKLFGVFQRLHTTEEFEGTGIGLATVRRIIKRHDGSVWAVGDESVGATFFFTLHK